MDSIAVVVPVRGRNPKSRLGTLLTVKQRRQLLVAMLEDVLQAILKAGMMKDAFVVSSDAEFLKFAGRYGARAILEDGERGVNEAVREAMRRVADYDAWMVVPADIPFIDPKDLKNVVSLYRMGARVVIGPAEGYDGTNILLAKKGSIPALHYDDDSFRKHFRDATSSSTPVSVYYSETVAFDIDSARDVHRAFRIGRRCSTMTFLGRVLGRTAMRPRVRSHEREDDTRRRL